MYYIKDRLEDTQEGIQFFYRMYLDTWREVLTGKTLIGSMENCSDIFDDSSSIVVDLDEEQLKNAKNLLKRMGIIAKKQGLLDEFGIPSFPDIYQKVKESIDNQWLEESPDSLPLDERI